jgi:hypothetical protein
MKLYAGKEAEEVFYRIVSGANTSDNTFQASKSNEKAGQEMAKNVLEYLKGVLKEGVVEIISKPSIAGKNLNRSREPKSDMVIVTTSGRRLRISLKKNSKDSGVGNFTTNDSFMQYMKGFVDARVPGAQLALDEAMRLFATKVGLHTMFDKRHFTRFEKEVRNPKHEVPAELIPQFIAAFKDKQAGGEYDDQYADVIEKPQAGIRQWIRWLAEDNASFFESMLLESITGERNFGDQDAAANLVVTREGVYTPTQYVPVFIAAKFSRGTDVGRIRKMPRAGDYDAKKSFEDNLAKFALVSAAIAW